MAAEPQATQTATTSGSHNIIVQIAGDGNSVTVGLPHLTLIPPRNRVREIRNEIDLLNPYCRSISLVGREADMQSLWEWLHSPKPISVRTLKGRAGAGKTRLAIELIERLNAEKPGAWFAGFVRGTEMARFTAQQNLSEWGWARPTLVVIDYAASHLETLRDWLRDLALNPARNRANLRLLLLEREANANEGWLQHLCSGGFSDAKVPELFDPLEPKHLEPLDTPEKRRAVLGQMLSAGAKLVEYPPPKIPAPGQDPLVDKQLENPEWADPLYLLMAALLSLRSDLVAVLQLPRTELALQLVTHEIQRLVEGAPRGVERLPVHLAAFAALGNGLSQELALKVAAEECAALGLSYPGGAGALVKHVHEVLPGPDFGIAPVVPDILAEALVLQAMQHCSVAQQEEAILRAVKSLGRRVIPFILRTIQDFAIDELEKPSAGSEPELPVPRNQRVVLLQKVKLWDWLKRLIQAGQTDDIGVLLEIESAMPEETLILREKAVEVTELLATRFSKLAGNNPTEAFLAEQSRLLNNLSNRLGDVGRCEEALAHAEEAMRLRCKLAHARPEAFLPNFAMALHTLANRMSELGRREEALAHAEEAVRLFRQFAVAQPEAFLPYLGASLSNLANRMSDLGRREEALALAQDAIRLYVQLAHTRPEAFLPDLAMALHNAGKMLSDSGRRDKALANSEEAVRLYRQLARARPESYLPNLSTSLNTLAAILGNLGRHEEALAYAEEAVRYYRQLAHARPEAFLPYLAASLNTLANTASDLGRRNEALAHAEEALRFYRQLAHARPEAFLPNLATALNTLGSIFGDLDRQVEALATAEEAVQLYRQLAHARPEAFLPNLAAVLNNMANRLSRLARHEEACVKAEESVRLYRQFVHWQPDIFVPELALSLNNLAVMLCDLGQLQQALPHAEESVRLRRQQAQQLPATFGSGFAISCCTLANILQTLQRPTEAATFLTEAIQTLTPLLQNNPAAFAPLMAKIGQLYLQTCEKANSEHDVKMLAPVLEVLKKLNQNQNEGK